LRKRHLFWIVPLVLVAAGLAGFFLVLPGMVDKSINAVERREPRPVSDDARVLHATLNVADLHADPLLWKRDLTQRWDRGQVDIPRLIEGNVVLQVFSTVTKSPPDLNYEENSGEAGDDITLLAIAHLWPLRSWSNLTERALHQARKLHGFAAGAPDGLVIVKTAADLDEMLRRRAAGEAVVGGLLATEGSHALSGDLDNIAVLYDAGFRMMSLQHFFDNRLGGSLHGKAKKGLTEFGKQVVGKMEEVGIMIDVSHSSENVVRDTLEIARRPLIVSHTGTRGHCNTPRNISDELMVRIAQKGGLIGIGFWQEAVCDASPAGIAKAIRAAVDLVGADHVALGSDFDGAVTTQIDASELVRITDALLELGMDEQTIRKVMGQNQIDFIRANLPAG
jgi:microsomal dipeptidase-like Zn-dependent dipeptidase